VLDLNQSFFDYGCGHGGDIERLKTLGYRADGYDPFYRPAVTPQHSDVVNLGYVLNVIEDVQERREALLRAWELTERVLVVSAQVLLNYLSGEPLAFSDGVITQRNTFQKYFKQEELAVYIQQVLNVDPIPAGLGIFFVFRDETQAEGFRASRFHSVRSTPAIQLRTKRFEDFKVLLTPLMDFIADRGRLPHAGELNESHDIAKEFGSLHSAFKVILQATNKSDWDQITIRRQQDLLVYCALANFTKRPRFGQLPISVQHDLKAFFGNYKTACSIADDLLFSLGQPDVISSTCRKSKVGKLVPDGLYVHLSALNELDPRLRLYEGCASRTIGRMDDATLVKFHIGKPMISYLFYPDFDEDPHPKLHTSFRIDLRDLHVSVSDYSKSANPPVLHRKETFVSETYPLYTTFAELTKQEEAIGLLDETSTIGTANGWQARLKKLAADVAGHNASNGQTPAIRKGKTMPAIKISNEKRNEDRMTIDELKHFISKQMSVAHVYQPAILLALLEGRGNTTYDVAAKKCSELTGETGLNYVSALRKYPAEALRKRGIIQSDSGSSIRLNMPTEQLSDSVLTEMKDLCLERFRRKMKP
jgi:DNA phosphorothioation-associated putative methyltransferase